MGNKFLNSITFPKAYTVEPEFHSPTRKNVKTKKITYEVQGRELSDMERAKTKKLEGEGKEFSFGRTARLTKKERTIKKEIEYLNLYPEGLKIEFKAGINLIVGENGSGKTTLLNIIRNYIHKKLDGVYKDSWDREVHFDTQNLSIDNFFGWDFDKDNPLNDKKLKPVTGERGLVVAQKMAYLWSLSEESHGEINRASLDMFTAAKNCLIVFDEPESAISLQGQYEYWNKLNKLSEVNQILMITHSKVFMDEAGGVFDMDTKKWMASEDYFKKIKKMAK